MTVIFSSVTCVSLLIKIWLFSPFYWLLLSVLFNNNPPVVSKEEDAHRKRESMVGRASLKLRDRKGKEVHGGQIDPILWQNASWQYTRFNFIVESCENRTNDGREEKWKGQSEGKMINTNDKRKAQGEEEMKNGGRTRAAWVTNRHGTRGPRGVNNNKSNVGGDILCKKKVSRIEGEIVKKNKKKKSQDRTVK